MLNVIFVDVKVKKNSRKLTMTWFYRSEQKKNLEIHMITIFLLVWQCVDMVHNLNEMLFLSKKIKASTGFEWQCSVETTSAIRSTCCMWTKDTLDYFPWHSRLTCKGSESVEQLENCNNLMDPQTADCHAITCSTQYFAVAVFSLADGYEAFSYISNSCGWL